LSAHTHFVPKQGSRRLDSAPQDLRWVSRLWQAGALWLLAISLMLGAFQLAEAAPLLPTVPNVLLNGVPCDLIDAINAANSDTASGTCPAGAGDDTITLLDDVILADPYDDGTNGLPAITSTITIEGVGFTISRTLDAPEFRFFEVESGGVLTLNELTL
jgi:hypothetical protein